MSQHFIVHEHQTLHVEPHGILPIAAYQAFLARVGDWPSGTLTPVHQGLRTGAYCGLLRAEDWSLEILPKIFDSSRHATERGLLVKMLSECFDLAIWQDETVNTDLAEDLLTVLIQAFIAAAQQQYQQGWLKCYVTELDALNLPRGRMQIQQQVRQGRAYAHKIYCEYDELTIDNPYNQIIKAALAIAQTQIPYASHLAQQAHQLWLDLAEISLVSHPLQLLHHLPQHRLTRRYTQLLQFASWLLQLLNPDIHAGEAEGFAVLFDMNRLFQDYVSNILERELRIHAPHLTLSRERPIVPLLQRADGTPCFKMMPDICIHHQDQLLAILDAKWKKIDAQASEMNQADLYQLLAYGYSYACPKLSLIYPYHAALQSWSDLTFSYAPHHTNAPELCVRTIDLQHPERHIRQWFSDLLPKDGQTQIK